MIDLMDFKPSKEKKGYRHQRGSLHYKSCKF